MCRLKCRKHPDQKYIEVDTTNILFIAGGAFVEIEKKIGSRLDPATLGYSKDSRNHVDGRSVELHYPVRFEKFWPYS